MRIRSSISAPNSDAEIGCPNSYHFVTVARTAERTNSTRSSVTGSAAVGPENLSRAMGETISFIVTELTGQAKAYYEANPDAAGSSTASGEASGEASQESASNEPEPMADGSGEAAADNG